MSTELQLRTGPYRTTFVGTEITRESTPEEWENYGEILKRVDEAKQWAIGDWLVDGKRHYGDKVYERASKLLGYDYQNVAKFSRLSQLYEIKRRRLNLGFNHHYEAASIKQTEEIYDDEGNPTGKLKVSKDEPDMDKIQELLETAEKERLSVRDLREKVRKHKEEQQEYIRLANEPEKYSVVYADPPWKYTSGDQHTYESQETVLETHYPSMTIQEISNVPVKSFTAENAVLFLWVTSPLLEESFQVIKAWGFQYKTSMVWDKVKHNVGNFVSVRHELLLICTKGQPPKVPKLVDSVYEEERTNHSKKPEYFRNLIEELYPNGKRIELFARTKPDRWDTWGDQVND